MAAAAFAKRLAEMRTAIAIAEPFVVVVGVVGFDMLRLG